MSSSLIGVSRSGDSSHVVYVRFANVSQRHVRLVWLDFEGKAVASRVLAPDSAHSLVTYFSHPWLFFDVDTDERLFAVNADGSKSAVFEADAFINGLERERKYEEKRIDDFRQGKALICVFIDSAVDKLRTLAFKKLRSCLRRKEDCFGLEVPQAIQFELARKFV